MNWKTLLVPHDFSTGAAKALAIAADLAARDEGMILLLHVTPIRDRLRISHHCV